VAAFMQMNALAVKKAKTPFEMFFGFQQVSPYL